MGVGGWAWVGGSGWVGVGGWEWVGEGGWVGVIGWKWMGGRENSGEILPPLPLSLLSLLLLVAGPYDACHFRVSSLNCIVNIDGARFSPSHNPLSTML